MSAASAFTIDVDSLPFYRQIHGLPPQEGPDPIYDVALPRFFDLLEEAQVPGTLFLIGQDAPAHAAAFSRLSPLRCEVASHSYAHDYHLSTRSPAQIRQDLEAADRALRPLSPSGRLVGFRAPGYNTSPALLQGVLDLGYRYDSSLLPAPLYFAARASAIALYALRGRPSASLVGRLAAFSGPLGPYRTTPAHPERPVDAGPLLELPMAVEPTSRLWLIGTTWVLLPAAVRRRLLTRALKVLPFFNFELHGIDLLDGSDPGIEPALVAAQPDLRVPVRSKMTAFRDLLKTLRDHGPVVPLSAAEPTVG